MGRAGEADPLIGRIPALRVLFTTQPESGHWHPLMPLARALDDAGHEVAFATTPAGCAGLAATGIRCWPVGSDESAQEVAERRKRLTALAPEDRAAVFWGEVFPETRAKRALPDVIDVIQTWRPAVVVREDLEFAGYVAAEREGLPHVAVQVAAWRPNLHALLASPLDRLRDSVGLPPDPDLAMLYRYLFLITSPPRYRDPTSVFPPTAQGLRPVVFDRSGDERLPDWVEQLPPERPTVYATMGTVNNKEAGVLESILAGLRDEPINFIMTTSRDRDPAAFGSQPPNVHIEQYVPQSLLFPYCDLVVTHGGTGTVMAALGHGLPMVIIPIAADQPDNARRCSQLGVARTIGPEERTPEAIRTAVRTVLAEPRFGEQAMRLREEIAAMPGIENAVSLLERLAIDRQPVASTPLPACR